VDQRGSRQAFVTVSVDDGHVTDMRTAELLAKYGIRATFYVPARNPERPVISEGQIRQLATSFELGGHTMNHAPLNCVPLVTAWEEVSSGKVWLEDVLGRRVTSFCYPRGKYSRRIAATVKKAGFLGARTCFLNRHDFPADPYSWGVSTQGRDHSRVIQLRHALLEHNFRGALNFLRIHRGTTDWATHFSYALEWVRINGGVAHLYFHSWEIDEAGEWNKLDRVLRQIRAQTDLRRVTNGELFAMWRRRLRHYRPAAAA
jgi:peptidoglycan/xylan/chitin deacetylase (PgdA/CDA1 family)